MRFVLRTSEIRIYMPDGAGDKIRGAKRGEFSRMRLSAYIGNPNLPKRTKAAWVREKVPL